MTDFAQAFVDAFGERRGLALARAIARHPPEEITLPSLLASSEVVDGLGAVKLRTVLCAVVEHAGSTMPDFLRPEPGADTPAPVRSPAPPVAAPASPAPSTSSAPVAAIGQLTAMQHRIVGYLRKLGAPTQNNRALRAVSGGSTLEVRLALENLIVLGIVEKGGGPARASTYRLR